ncbi:MAG: HEPN domain-containing protein [Bacillota bacterium]|nr:HEPN domain-containing protein [Bacillota bacterium]MDI7250261.1 HEPN domain-containing protein [Bacillota bacterium]
MKSDADVARGWIKKADSDLQNVRIVLKAGDRDAQDLPYDTLCFHAQQAVEKYLKAPWFG